MNMYLFSADFHHKATRFFSKLLVAALLSLHFSPAMAEGSKDLYPQSYSNGLDMADLDWRCRAMLVSASSAVDRPFSTRGTFRVYAKAGEHLRFASSALNAATADDCTGSIVWRAPNGESGTIVNNSEGGYIADRDQELAGPNYGAFNGGYDAYKIDVTAATEGVWEIEFHGKDDNQTAVPTGVLANIYDFNTPHSTLVYPSMTSENEWGNTITYNADWHTNVWVENEEANTPGTGKTYDIRDGATNGYYNGANVSNVFISAFDITVTDASDMNVIEGRMYTNVLNLAAWGPKESTSRWYGTLYVLNHNGSIAVFTPDGMCGDNISLFANNKGITSGGKASYKSATSLTTHDPRTTDVVSQLTDADGKKVDVYEDVTYKIFFNKPASDLPTVATKCVYGSSVSKTWLRKETVDSDPKITDFNIVGKGGVEGGSSSKGSDIVFTSPMQGTYSIELRFSNNRYKSLTLTGNFFAGDNAVEWDGKDGSGKTVSTGQKVTAKGYFTFSEFHFPLYDVARNVGGFSINIKDATASNNLTKTIYWDDSDVTTVSTNSINAGNSKADGTSGEDSPSHKWGKPWTSGLFGTTNNYDDDRGENTAIDTWAYQSTSASKTVTLTDEQLDIALTAATGGADCAAIGDEVTYSLTVQNVSSKTTNANAKGAKLGLITYDADGNRLDGFAISSITTTAAASDAYVITPSEGTIFVKNGKTATFTVVGSFSTSVAHKTISVKAYVMHPADLVEVDANNADDPTDPIEEYDGVTNNNFQDLATQTFITNNAPVANDDSYSLIESQTLVGNVLDNDVDPDGDPIIVSRFWIDGDEYQAGETASVNEGTRDSYYTVGSITVAKDGTLTFIATNLFAESSSFSITYEVAEDYTADASAKCPDPDAQSVQANVTFSYGMNYAPDIEPTTFNIKGRKNPVKIPILIFDRDNDPLTLSLSGADASKFRFDYSDSDTTLYYIGGPLKEDATYHINISAYDGSVKTTEAVTVNVSKIATPYFKHDGDLWLGVPQCTNSNAATRYDAVRTALILDEDVAIPQDINISSSDFAFFDGQLYYVWNYNTAKNTGTKSYNLTVSFTDSEGLDWSINLTVYVNCNGAFYDVYTTVSAEDGFYGSTIEDLLTYHAYFKKTTPHSDITSAGPWTFSEDGIPYQLTDVLSAGAHTVKIAYSPRDVSAAFADKDDIVKSVSFTINKRNVTITSDSKTRVYNKEPLEAKSVTTTAFTSVSDGNGFIGDEGVVCDNFAYIIEVGSKPNDFTCEAKDNTDLNNYNITTKSGTLTVTKRVVDLSEIEISAPNCTYNGKPQTPTIKLLVDGKVVTPSAYDVTFSDNVNAGTATIVIKDKGVNKNYSIPDYTGHFTIAQREVKLDWGTTSFTYNAREQSVKATLSNVIDGDDVKVSSYEDNVKTDVGTYFAKALTLSNANYKLPKGNGTYWYIETLDLDDYTITLAPKEFTYDATAHEPKVTITATVDGEKVTIPSSEYTVTYYQNVNASTTAPTVTITDAADGNYNLAEKSATFVINPAELQVVWDYTAPFTYDGTVKRVAVKEFSGLQGSDVIESDDITYTGKTSATAANNADVPSYSASVSINSINYTLDAATTSLTWKINKATIDPYVKYSNDFTFNGKAQKPTDVVVMTAEDGETLLEGTDYEITWPAESTTAGDKSFNIKSLDASNYSFDVDKVYTIKKKPVSLTWVGDSEYTYDATEKSVSATIATAATGYPCTAVLTNAAKTNAGTYQAKASLSDADNYEFDAASVTTFDWVIKQSELTAEWDGVSVFTYDGKSKSVSVKLSPIHGSDVCKPVGTGTLSATEAGSYTYTVTGVSNSNYVLAPATQELTWTINKKSTTATVSVSPAEAVYDGTTHTPIVTVTDDDDNVIALSEYTATWSGTLKDADTYTVTVVSNDVNYSFADATATYTITKRSVTLTSASDSKSYDGTALTNSNVTISGDGFASGEGVASYNVTGTITNVGSVDNAFTYTLKANTKASNYDITTKVGTLEVTKAVGTQTAALDETVFTYDATVHHPAVTVKVGSLVVPSTEYTVEYPADCVNASDDELNVTIKNVTGGNFDITTAVLTFKINKATATIVWDNDSFTYDGNAKTVTPSVSNPVNSTDAFTFTYAAGSVTTASEAGSYNATVSDLGNSNYSIASGASHDWTIVKKSVTAKVTITDPTSRLYDGTDYTPAVKVTDADGNVIAPAEYTVAYTPATDLKNVGQKTVTVTSNGINFKFANTPTAKYEITKRSVTLTSASDSKSYDGTALTNSNVTISGDGFASGEGVASYNVTGTITNVGSVDNAFTYTLKANTKASNYDITTKVGTLEVTKAVGTQTAALDETVFTYDATVHHPAVTVKVGSLVVPSTEYTVEYPADCVNASDDELNVTIKNVTGGNFDITTAVLTFKINKATATIVWDNDSFTYDGNAKTVTPSVSNPVNSTDAFTFTYAAGSVTTASEAGSYNATVSDLGNSNYSIASGASHDWTIVKKSVTAKVTITDPTSRLYDGTDYTPAVKVTDADGNVIAPAEYTVAYTPATDLKNVGQKTVTVTSNDINFKFANTPTAKYEITKRNVTLTSATASKVYDGSALTDDNVTISGDGFATGEGATFSVTGSQTEVGSSDNAFTYTLKANTSAANYSITKEVGKLSVTSKSIDVTVSLSDDDFLYDGTIHKPTTVTVTDAEGNVIDAEEYTISYADNADLINAGPKTVTVTSNGVNFTFKSVTPATYTIKKRGVTLTSASDTKTYDGTALTNSNVTVSGDGFVSGQGATYTFTGSQTEKGSSENKFSYTLTGGAVATNYDITEIYGTLEVTAKTTTVSVVLDKTSALYNGAAHTITFKVVDVEGNEIAADQYDAVYSTTDFTNAGSVEVSIALKTSNYVFTNVTPATYTISKRGVKLTSVDATKTYDGTPLTGKDVIVSGDGFVTGEGATYTFSGSQTNVGSSDNKFAYTLNANTKASNYEITTAEGTLTVNAKVLDASKIDIITSDKVYTGEAQEPAFSVTIEGEVASADQYELSFSNNVNVGTATVTVKPSATSNYSFVDKSETFNITAATLTVTGSTVADRVYDGTKNVSVAVGTVNGIMPADAGNVSVSATATVASADAADNKAVTIVYAINGSAAANYVIATDDTKTVNITPKEVTLTWSADELTYNGSEQSVSATVGSLVSGDACTVTSYTNNSATEVGTYTASATALSNANYKLPADASHAWKIVAKKINVSVVLDPADPQFKYNGQEQYANFYVVDEEGNTIPASEYTAQYKNSNSEHENDIKNVGFIEVSVISNGKNYTFDNVEPGYYLINRRRVTALSGSASKVYDGTALTKESVTIGGDMFIDGEGFDFNYTGSQTEVGSSENTFTTTPKAGTNADNYYIVPTYGTLTVTSKELADVTCDLTPSSYTYDGTAHEPVVTLKSGDVTIPASEYSVTYSDNTNAGTAKVTVTNVEGGNFTVPTKDFTFTIEQRVATLAWSATSLTYNGAEQVVTAIVTNIVASDACDVTTYTGNAATTVGNYTATATAISNDNYKLPTDASHAWKIVAQVVDPSALDIETYNVTYNGLDQTPEFVVTLNGVTLDKSEYVYSYINNRNVGLATVSIEPSADSNYSFATVSEQFTIEPATLTVSGTVVSDKEYDGTLTMDVTVGSVAGIQNGEDITLTAVATATTKDAAVNKPVNVVYTIVGATSANYVVANETLSAEINKRKITLESATASKTYDGLPLTAETVNVTSGSFAAGEGFTYDNFSSITTAQTVDNEYQYHAKTGTDLDNYEVTANYGTLTVKPASATEQVISYTASFVYTGEEIEPEVNILIDGNVIDKSEYSVAYSNNLNVGTATITVANVDGGNYVIDDATRTFQITPAALTVSGTTIDDRPYDGTTIVPVTPGTLQGLKKSDTLVLSASAVALSKDAANDIPVTVTYTIAGDKKDNYTIDADNTFSVNITPAALTLTSATATKTYDTTPLTDHNVDAVGFVAGESFSYSVSGSQTNAGSSKNTFSYTADAGTTESNYQVTKVEGDLTVTAAEGDATNQKVVLSADAFTYNGNQQRPDVTVTINGLTVPASEYTINWPANTTDASADALEVTIVDNEGGNFVVANDGFSFVINPVDITLESADATKVYDRTPLFKEQVNVVSGAFVAGEGFTYDNFASITEVGEVDNTFAFHADAATKLSNYNVTVNTGKLIVTAKSFNVSDITASFDQDSYVYTGLQIEPVVELKVGDLVIPASEYVITFENNVNVGTAKVKVTNAADGNYVIPDCEFTFTITPATLTVSGTTLSDKVYDGNTDVTVNVGTLEGVKASDLLSVTATAVAASKDAADGVGVTISYALSGDASGNYILADDNTLSINISPREITFTSADSSKVYDGTALQNESVNVDNIVSGEAFTFTNFASITEVGEVDNTFDYAPQDGTLASNYDIHVVNGKLSITSKVIDAADINCEFESLDYTYNGHEFKPLVTLRLADDTMIPASEYFVTYVDNIDAGVNTAKAQITNADGGNYTLPDVEFAFSIAQREVTLTWSDTELVYNGLEQGPALTIGEIQTRLVEGVEVADVVNATITGDKQVNVGDYTAEVLSLDNANYILPATTTQDWEIKKQQIAPDAIQILTASVPYNGNYQEPTFEVTINGETLNAAEYELSFSNNRNVGDNTAIVTVKPSATSNYDFADKSEQFSITPLTLTVSGTTVADKVYDGDVEMPVTAGSLVGLISGDDVTLAATAEAADKNAADDAKVVNVVYSLTGADSGNYLISGETLSAYISKRKITLTSADAEKTFDNTPLKSEVVNVTVGSIVAGEGFVYSNFASRIAAGSEPNKFDFAADANTIADNYDVTAEYGTLTVKPASSTDQAVALEQTTYEYTGEPIKPKVIITIGGVEIDETEYDVVYSNNTNVGEATVTITNREGGNYVIEIASTTFTITPATLTVSGTTLSDKVYDGNTDVAVNVGTLEGVKASDLLSVTATAVAASKDAADGVGVTISYALSGDASGNYILADDNTLSINISPREITFTSADSSKVYDGTALQNESVNVDNIVSGEAFTFTNFASITEVGEVDNTFDYAPQDGTLASNYDIHVVNGKLSITSKVIDAADINCEFESLDYTYNGHEFKPLVTLRLADDTMIPASEYFVTYVDNIDAGVNTAKAQITNADGGNYTLPDVEFAFSIAQREVTLTWSDTELVYNGLEQGPALTIGEIQTRLVEGVEVADVVNATITGDKQVNVGDYTAEVLSLDNANYILPATTTQDWKISKATLSDDITIEVVDNNLVYNAKPQVVEFVLRKPDGSIIPASEYVVTFENNVDASDNAKIIVTNAEGGNLVVPTISTTFSIKPAPLTISVSNVTTTKQYDGNNATKFDNSVEGVIEGTDPQYEVNVTFDNANVGTGKTITATYSVANTNYVLTTNSEVVTTSGEITPIALTVSGTVVDNKVFDGNVSANVSTIGKLNGVILNQDVAIAGAEATFADKNVDTSKPVTVKFTLTGADAANYTIDDATLSADITTLTLTVSGAAVDSKVYDATTAAVISNAGALSGASADIDVQVATAVASFADKNVGVAKPVTVKFTLSGADAANCSVTDATLSADITPKALTVSGAISSPKKFDNTTAAKLAYYGSLIGVIFEDDVTIDTVATVATFADAQPGTGKVVNVVFALTGADAANYTVEDATLTDGVITALQRDKSMYNFYAPANTIYDGTPKVAVVTGPGQITLFYSSDNGVTWSTDAPVNVAHYIVKINVAADEEYEAAEITDDSWFFDVTKGLQEAPALTGKPTSRPSADDGQIIGLTTDMEIRLDGQSTYQKVTNTEVLFAAGTYYVRYVETDNYLASNETAVTIDKGAKLNRVIEDYTVTLPEYLGYNGNPKEATVEGPGVITVYYKQAGGTWTTTKPVDMGTYFVKFTVDEDIDYNFAEFADGAWTFTITREPLVIDGFVLTAHGYCPGSEGVVKFNIVTGDPVEFRFAVIDTTAAVNYPITESEYQELTSDSEFTFTMPNATEGKRTLQVQFRESDGLASEVYSLEINVNLTNEYLTDIWYDVVSIINKVDLNTPDDLTPRFQAYKWYRDGEELAGQTKPYVQQIGGLQGTYYAQVTTTDALGAEVLYTCPKTWDGDNKSLTLRVYPNPVVTIANVELSQNDGNDHDISIVDNKGLTLYRGTFNGATTSVNMSSYEAGYYIIIVDNLKANVVKK